MPADSNTYGNGDSVVVLDGSDMALSGYTFAGWSSKADGKGVNLTAGNDFRMGNANVILYAQWDAMPETPASYTVSYDGNGSDSGTAPADGDAYLCHGGVTVLGKGDLAKSGCDFSGWNTASDGSGILYTVGDVFHIGTHNITLYAVWGSDPAFTVTYYGNDNTGGAAPSDSNEYRFGMTAAAPDNTGNLSKTGYQFDGWNTAADGAGTTYSSGSEISIGNSDISMYAKWSIASHTLSYDGNGNTGGSAPSSITLYGVERATAADCGNLVRSGYRFSGWNTAADGSGTGYDFGDSFAITSNIVLYAQWTKKSSGDSDTTPKKTITVAEASSQLFGGSKETVKAEANMNNAFSTSVEVRVTDTKQDASSFGLGAESQVYPSISRCI